MEDYIAISTLNDFSFCPYSIYLHNVYRDTDETLYHAAPQTKGKATHQTIDHKTLSTRAEVLLALPIYSDRYHIFGKIDVYNQQTRTLIERKYQLKHIFQGQRYQLWAQYFCLREMGYPVEHLAFYEISTNKTIPIPLPSAADKREFQAFITSFRRYDPLQPLATNPNKCVHCIYCNICDKTDVDNVYT